MLFWGGAIFGVISISCRSNASRKSKSQQFSCFPSEELILFASRQLAPARFFLWNSHYLANLVGTIKVMFNPTRKTLARAYARAPEFARTTQKIPGIARHQSELGDKSQQRACLEASKMAATGIPWYPTLLSTLTPELRPPRTSP